jgi:ribosomal protein S26
MNVKQKKEMKTIEYLTVGQLKKACINNKFILVRFANNYQFGLNCRIPQIISKKQKTNDNKKTQIVSFIACDINTYITYKHPYF